MRTIYLGHNPRYAAVCHKETDLRAVFWHECKGNIEQRASEMLEYCRQNKIVTIFHYRIDDLVGKIMKACEPDIIVVGEYNFLLKKDDIKIANIAAINLHGAPLPRYRGAHPINWMIINGETEGAVTCHYISEGLDKGDIIAQYTFPILPYETAYDVRPKIDATGERLLRDVFEKFDSEGRLNGTPQDENNASYFPPRKPEDGLIDWEMPALNIFNFVRALSKPYPGAYTFLNGCKFTIWRALLSDYADDSVNSTPGTIVKKTKDFFIVAAGDGGFIAVNEWDSNGCKIEEHRCFQRA